MSRQGNVTTFSAFKQAQIRHRRQGNNPCRADDLHEVVDFGTGNARIIPLQIPSHHPMREDLYKGPIYGLRGFPGFIFAPQALKEELQNAIAIKAVTAFCESPHRTNIDLCPPKESEPPNLDESMWNLWKKTNEDEKSMSHLSKGSKKRKLQLISQKKFRSFKKLSWATCGYHYDWTARSYNKESKSTMPGILSNLSKVFAKTSLVLDNMRNSQVSDEKLHFAPEASIVNYYNTKSLMGGHRDELEIALDKPVISLSLGLSAIFLLGGKSKEEHPVLPILIRAGDVMCLGGDTRLNYHSMARVLPSTVPLPDVEPSLCPADSQKVTLDSFNSCNEESVEALSYLSVSDHDLAALDEYLKEHRININIRQVYPQRKR